jgi:hypothetical protein
VLLALHGSIPGLSTAVKLPLSRDGRLANSTIRYSVQKLADPGEVTKGNFMPPAFSAGKLNNAQDLVADVELINRQMSARTHSSGDAQKP